MTQLGALALKPLFKRKYLNKPKRSINSNVLIIKQITNTTLVYILEKIYSLYFMLIIFGRVNKSK